MTLDEFKLIRHTLNNQLARMSEDDKYYFPQVEKDTIASLTFIDREINLKTMDPRKSKEDDINRCICVMDLNKLIINSHPACPEHGISQQLNKSQME